MYIVVGRLRLIPRHLGDHICQILEEHLPNPHRVYPHLFIKRDKPTHHEHSVGFLGEGGFSELV